MRKLSGVICNFIGMIYKNLFGYILRVAHFTLCKLYSTLKEITRGHFEWLYANIFEYLVEINSFKKSRLTKSEQSCLY